MAKSTVLCYRVLKDGMKVGHDVRVFGELIPEARDWPNLDVYLRNSHVEKVYVTPAELEAAKKDFAKREIAGKKKADALAEKMGAPVAQKTEKKKRVVIKKKGKSDARLAEQSV